MSSQVTRLDVPSYDDLPRLASLDLANSWDVFGPNDELGTLNLIDDACVLRALQEAQTGERIGVTLSMTAIDPPLYGREALSHVLIQSDRNTWDERLDAFYTQGASQWDGFRHVRCREFGYYGGVMEDPPEMGRRLGMQHWADKGIVTRGVLLDVERYLTTQNMDYDAMKEVSVGAALLEECAHAQGVEIRQGDVLCLRFGWVSGYRRLDEIGRRSYADKDSLPTYAGLAADETMASALWNWHVSAVACDNPAAEVSPGNPAIGSLHRRLIPALGIVMGELFDFDALAERCADDDRWSFLFMSVPLNLEGGIGSPANSVAIR
jgi:kynurenine formamidase